MQNGGPDSKYMYLYMHTHADTPKLYFPIFHFIYRTSISYTRNRTVTKNKNKT